MRKILFLWLNGLLVLAGVTIICLFAVEQTSDLHTYESLDQLSLQAKQKLNQGTGVTDLLAGTDVATDYTPFIIVYDQSNNVLYTNAVNGESSFTLPLSLAITDQTGIVHQTWKPENTHTYAISTQAYDTGYVSIGVNIDAQLTKTATVQKNIVYLSIILAFVDLPVIIGFKKVFNQ